MRAGQARIFPAAVGVIALVAATACGTGSSPTTASRASGTVTVFAAASLTEAFTTIGTDFQTAHPGSTVRFNFGGSSGLAAQINQGAPADVFAAASSATMKAVTDAGNAEGDPAVFVRNRLVIAVTKGNPKHLAGLADLAGPGVKVALCAPEVPCGTAAGKALDTAHVSLTPVTLEQDVKSALAKVKLGEVDAALVYRTDITAAASDVEAVEFPESAGAVNDYPIVVLKHAPDSAGAKQFVAYVLSDRGRAVLTAAGFQAP